MKYKLNLINYQNGFKYQDLLYRWCNDTECRKNSLHTHVITYDEHCKWFEEKLNAPNCYMYICQSDDMPVGQIRVQIENRNGEISYSIAKEHRGKGIGKKMLMLLEQQPEIIKRIDQLSAIVKAENIASVRCFEKRGYECKMEGELYHFFKKLR